MCIKRADPIKRPGRPPEKVFSKWTVCLENFLWWWGEVAGGVKLGWVLWSCRCKRHMKQRLCVPTNPLMVQRPERFLAGHNRSKKTWCKCIRSIPSPCAFWWRLGRERWDLYPHFLWGSWGRGKAAAQNVSAKVPCLVPDYHAAIKNESRVEYKILNNRSSLRLVCSKFSKCNHLLKKSQIPCSKKTCYNT